MLTFIKKLLNLNSYTSGLDQYLGKLKNSYPQLSASQQRALSQYRRVFSLRDKAQQPPHPAPKLWDQF